MFKFNSIRKVSNRSDQRASSNVTPGSSPPPVVAVEGGPPDEGGPEWVNNLNRTALQAIKEKMRADPSMGSDTLVMKAEWKDGVVNGASGLLVCYAPPELQLGSKVQAPTVNSFCPIVSSACFCLVLMLDAADHGYHFESLTAQMKAKADMIGFYKPRWAGATSSTTAFPVRHAWADGIKLGIVIRANQSQEELLKLADHADKHCPASEIMKRSFPAEITKFALKKPKGQDMDWTEVPVHYNMDKYVEIGKLEKFMVDQEVNLTWHCQNESVLYPDSLMTLEFTHENNYTTALSHDKPLSSGKYANPLQMCFFGGLSSLMHTIACRIYAKGYKLTSIQGTISATLNKRKVMAVDIHSYIFPDGANIEIDVVSDCPEELMEEIQYEVEEMSLTMMNWRQELPFLYGVAVEEPLGTVCSGMSSVCGNKSSLAADSLQSDSSQSERRTRDPSSRKSKRGGILNFLWKMSS